VSLAVRFATVIVSARARRSWIGRKSLLPFDRHDRVQAVLQECERHRHVREAGEHSAEVAGLRRGRGLARGGGRTAQITLWRSSDKT
jgi:hypothetical protein